VGEPLCTKPYICDNVAFSAAIPTILIETIRYRTLHWGPTVGNSPAFGYGHNCSGPNPAAGEYILDKATSFRRVKEQMYWRDFHGTMPSVSLLT
jgi:hypothetical protein